MSDLLWMECACYVWPIVPGWMVRRCGLCGSAMLRVVDEPASGKAQPK